METATQYPTGTRVRFDGKRTVWTVRATTKDGRYALLTCAEFGKVYYTIVDNTEEIRGPMNVSGGGLGIFTTKGPDKEIDKAIQMLEGTDKYGPPGSHWEVSHRNRVPVNVTWIGAPK